MHKNATKCNKTQSKWCINKHGASKIIDTLETYHGTIVSVRSESHYLEFNMAVSVQSWRKKWFYIKDQKVVSSDKFGIAPFNASKILTKLTSWDSPPTKAEVEEIKPHLTQI
jgi:hypothetical protein